MGGILPQSDLHPTPDPDDWTLEGMAAWAEFYARLGWNPIPLRRDKRPVIAWAPYQRRRVTPEELEEWRRRYPGANVGIVTGAISGVVVLDVDGPEGKKTLRARHLPPTPTVTTGKGMHLYFRHPGRPVSNFTRRLPGLDFRGDGGYVMAPPSVHPSGRRYAWVEGLSPWDLDPAPLPDWLAEVTEASPPAKGTRSAEAWREMVSGTVTEGHRNDTLARLAGHLLRRGVDPYVTLDLLLSWNQDHCSPPLAEAEVARTVDSIAGAELRRRGGAPRG